MTCKYSKTLATSKSKTQSATTQKINTNHHSSFLSLTDMTSRRNPLIYMLMLNKAMELRVMIGWKSTSRPLPIQDQNQAICSILAMAHRWFGGCKIKHLCVKLRMNLKKKEIFVEINQQIRTLSWTYTGFKCNLSRKKELQAKKES